jgi:hypothetical protein
MEQGSLQLEPKRSNEAISIILSFASDCVNLLSALKSAVHESSSGPFVAKIT